MSEAEPPVPERPASDPSQGVAVASQLPARDLVAGMEVLEQLGEGAQTVVYRARRGASEYALKVLRGPALDDRRALAAFRREAALLACVDHPGLARIHEVGEAHGRPYLVMELVEGRVLADLLRDGPLPQERLIALAIDVADVLAATQRAGLAHRDLKPHNLLVQPDGRTRVVDFGLAALTGAAAAADDETAVGTITYSAPEQTGMLNRPVDGRADLYALGVVLFECATGVPPFAADDPGELLRLHAVATPPDPRELRADLSAGLAAVIGKLLAKDPDDRYQSGAGLIADLRKLRRQPEDAAIELGVDDEPAAVSVDTELVGRDAELAALRERWWRACAGEGGVALLRGAPGGGKTRLARELLAVARADGHLVLTGKCSPDEAVPLAPLRAAVERHLRAVAHRSGEAREQAAERVRAAAGPVAPLLKTLSPALADILQAPDLAQQDRQEQFAAAAAAFLAELARLEGGAVLLLEDVQWLDVASRRVLQALRAELGDAPLLLVATARDDNASLGALESLRGELGDAVDLTVTLGPLDDEAVGRLVANQLGGASVTGALVAQIAARAAGNPFTVLECLRAIVDGGVVRPSWGTWLLDEDALARLELPEDVLEVVLARIDGLDDATHSVLVAAAATGTRFGLDHLPEVCEVDQAQVRAALADAVERRLVEPGDGGVYAFVHDRIREALLGSLDDKAARRLHQRIAVALDVTITTDPEHLYAVARQFALGEAERTPYRAHHAFSTAGQLAISDHAPVEAVGFLELAAALAVKVGITPYSAFHQALGVAYLRSGRLAEAKDQLGVALDLERQPLRRAELLHLLGLAYSYSWDSERSLAAIRQGLAALGHPLPRNRLALAASTLLEFLAGAAVGRLRLGFGTATGGRRERYRLCATMLSTGAQAAGMGLHMDLMGMLCLRALYMINRLGPSPEYARGQAMLGLLTAMFHLRRTAGRRNLRAAEVAERTGDQALVAEVGVLAALGEAQGFGDVSLRRLRGVLERHARWMGAADYLSPASYLCAMLVARGDAREALAWYERGNARMAGGGQANGNTFAAVGISVLALLGRALDAAAQLESVRETLEAGPSTVTQRCNLAAAATVAAVEQGELGEPFERAIADWQRAGAPLNAMWLPQRSFYVWQAYGRLAQCLAATGERRGERLRAAERALRELRRAADLPLLRAHHHVARASYLQLRGDQPACLKQLEQTERLAWRLDAPLVIYEVARVRARALRELGHAADAQRQARFALQLALEQGWEYRARWIRSEFAVNELASTQWYSRPGRGSSSSSDHAGVLQRRRLDALQRVSLAAATVLDPRELAGRALDETISILSAERAFLFVLEPRPGGERLVPLLGRDADGHDLDQLTGYSSTLVERVRGSGEALVVTGSEEGAALGSQSALVHGLRSIMVAPMRLKGRLLGVVYLDSRVAKGIFTADDVDLLAAITNHIAVSLETARAAQLEVAVQAAQRQRDLAETLRGAMAEISATLDPGTVLERLLHTVARVLPGDSACLLRLDGAEVTVAMAGGSGGLKSEAPAQAAGGEAKPSVSPPVDRGSGGLKSEAPAQAAGGEAKPSVSPPVGRQSAERRLDLGQCPGLAAVLGAPSPGPAPTPQGAMDRPLEELLGRPRSWLTIPLGVRGDSVGVVLVASAASGAYEDAHAKIGAALAAQGMVAYENARLFSQVQQLATTDGLTGIANRRHFWELAEHQVAVARRHNRPLAAVMLDIDHFKQVNDTYGHAAGDEVLQQVTTRLLAGVRASDLLGRYGGEEFALILPEIEHDAHELADRLRAAVAGAPLDTVAGPVAVTLSAGVTYLEPADADVDALLARADYALYQAKQAGRNRVVAL
jgi:eukaryotic-like serine/threonine-protein kinase